MVFRRCTIGGTEFSHQENALRLAAHGDVDSDEEEAVGPQRGHRSRLQFNSKNKSTRAFRRCHSAKAYYYGGYGRKKSEARRDSEVAFSSPLETDVTPDKKLMKIVREAANQMETWCEVRYSSDSASYVDFFLALAICNTVVVSTATEPRHRVTGPSLLKPSIKSLEKLHSFLQKLKPGRISQVLSSIQSNSDQTGGTNQISPSPSGTSVGEGNVAGECSSTVSGGFKDSGVSSKASMDSGDYTEGVKVGDEICYEAESPDEAALVHAAKAYNFTLMSRTPDHVTVRLPQGVLLTFEVLHTLSFDSTRKRMSVLVRHPITREIIVYTKGADSAIMDLLENPSQGRISQILSSIQSNSDQTGGTNQISPSPSSTSVGKENVAGECSSSVSGGFKDSGVSSKASMDSGDYAEGVKVGDEIRYEAESPDEAALVHAAKAYNFTLMSRTPDHVTVRLPQGVLLTFEVLHTLSFDSTRKRMSVLVRHPITREIIVYTKGADLAIMDLLENKSQENGRENQINKNASKTLKHLNWYAKDGLRTLCIAKKVLSEKSYEQWSNIRLEAEAAIENRDELLMETALNLETNLTLLGDGANDVNMIQAADVGIGIAGQEGMQAVMASDFAISHFKHLKKLLLVHGHWCYTRLSNMIIYFFYKNVAYVNLLFWYQFFCGFSGASMIDYWLMIFFNLFFTSLPPIIFGIMDKDISAETLLGLPELYKSGQNSEGYKWSTFWIAMLDAFYQSLICFFVPYLTFQGSDIDIFSFGTPINTLALFTILLHLAIEIKTWRTVKNEGRRHAQFADTRIHGLLDLFPSIFRNNKQSCTLTQQLVSLGYAHITLTLYLNHFRYLIRIIQGTFVLCPLLKAQQLDKLDKEQRDEEISEWRERTRSREATVPLSNLSPPTSPTSPGNSGHPLGRTLFISFENAA
ncbi:UNVERIFIED_CONTAM: hypothetical protein FKN15_009923 [Acipenser sinensis]